MKHLIPFVLMSLLVISCNKKELDEVELPPNPTWQLHDKFLHEDRFISNLYSADDKLQVMGMHLFSTISEKEDIKHYMHPFRTVSLHKSPMNSKVNSGTDGNKLYFRTVSSPVFGGDLIIDGATIDPHFKGFNLISSQRTESFAISENNVALVPYNFRDEKTGNIGLRYFLMKLLIDKDALNNERILMEEARILTPTEKGGVIRYMRSHQNNFYVTTDWGFYKISEEGNIDFQMPNQVAFASFEHKGILYAIARHAQKQTYGLHRSVSDISWAELLQLNDAVENLTYYAISDEILLASFRSQLFEVDLGGNQMIVKELDNTGLEGHLINSIAMANNKVYIGTQSGLFSKALESLLTYKELSN